MTDVVLSLHDVSVSYPVGQSTWRAKQRVRVVDSVSFELEAGEVVALVGESGCGKSTTARAIMRLVDVQAGRIVLRGTDITTLRERELRPLRHSLQMVFQDPYASLNPAMSVEDIIGEALLLRRVPHREASEQVDDLVRSVGLGPQYRARYPAELSGGQRQRVAIVRALAMDPEIIVCDEAVSALDVSTQNQIVDLLDGLRHERQLSYLFISHDLAIVRRLARRTLVMYGGRIVERGSTAELFATPLHPFTQALIAAVPTLTGERRASTFLTDADAYDPLDPPGGCRFHPRCPQAMDVCRTTQPAEVTVGDQAVACHLYRATEVPPPAPVPVKIEARAAGASGDPS